MHFNANLALVGQLCKTLDRAYLGGLPTGPTSLLDLGCLSPIAKKYVSQVTINPSGLSFPNSRVVFKWKSRNFGESTVGWSIVIAIQPPMANNLHCEIYFLNYCNVAKNLRFDM